jgi:hypothetical protein
MIDQLSLSTTQPREGLRPSSGSAGPARPAGAVPPEASSDVGPANPRMRIDRDLGMVVIEFRDAAGRVSVSLPTPREIEAYRASVKFGAEMPADVKGMNITPGGPSAARPGIPLPPEPERSPSADAGNEPAPFAGLLKIA